MPRKNVNALFGGLTGKTWAESRSGSKRGYGHPGFSIQTRPSSAYNFGKKIYDIRSAGRDAIDDTVESYANVLGKAQDAKDTFRESVNDTVGNWMDDQKDLWVNQAKKIRNSRKAASDYLSGLKGGRGKAGSANFKANVRSKSYQKGLSVRRGIKNKIKSIGGIRKGVRDAIDDVVGTWAEDQKDFWKRKK